jgi:hypothetical protein
MQTKQIYHVQHWLHGQWIREHNWCKVEAFSEREAAEKVCGVALTEAGKLAQLAPASSPWAIASKLERRRFMQSSGPLTPHR